MLLYSTILGFDEVDLPVVDYDPAVGVGDVVSAAVVIVAVVVAVVDDATVMMLLPDVFLSQLCISD